MDYLSPDVTQEPRQSHCLQITSSYRSNCGLNLHLVQGRQYRPSKLQPPVSIDDFHRMTRWQHKSNAWQFFRETAPPINCSCYFFSDRTFHEAVSGRFIETSISDPSLERTFIKNETFAVLGTERSNESVTNNIGSPEWLCTACSLMFNRSFGIRPKLRKAGLITSLLTSEDLLWASHSATSPTSIIQESVFIKSQVQMIVCSRNQHCSLAQCP